MELRHLRYFTVLAAELHYGRAAPRPYIAQPALSKQIALLEKELGVRLFDRTRRRVELTPAGTQLLPEAERLIELSNRFTQNSRRLREGLVGSLRLGYTGSVAESALPPLLRRYHRRYPDVILSLREGTTQAVLDDVRDGIYDAAFLRIAHHETDLRVLDVKAEPAILAIPEDHPFAGRSSIGFAELREQPLVMMTRAVEPELYDRAISLCAAAGFSPAVVHEADSVQTTLSMVSGGIGLAVVTESAGLTRRDGVVYRPLTDPTPSVTLSLAYRGDRAPAQVEALVAVVREMKTLWANRSEAVAGSTSLRLHADPVGGDT